MRASSVAKQVALRVCHIVSGDVWGGAEAIVFHLLRGQASLDGIDPSVIVLNEGRLADLVAEAGIPFRLIPEKNVSILGLIRAVDKAVGDLAPNVIHTHRYKENFLSYILARRHNARSIVTLHGHEPPTAVVAQCKVALRERVCWHLARAAGSRFVAVSHELRDRYQLSPDDCVVIPNGIPVRQTDSRSTTVTALSHSRVPVIGWVGRMVPIKGLSTLLDAIARIPPGAHTPCVLLVGDGPERSALETRAQRLGIAGRVQFVGFVPDPHQFLSRMDLFALPSLHEGVPLALLEALADGVPVVASAVGGLPAIIGDSGAARLVASHSPDAWAAALTELLADPKETREMAERGRRLVKERFTVEAMLDRYLRLYNTAAA